MYYTDFLTQVHRSLASPTYVEVGVRDGKSLSLSRSRSVAIDPEYAVKHELHCDVHLVKATSDDYFARPDALSEFDGQPAGLGFIDGMHLFEYAFRDFINIESHSDWCSVVVFDDMLPRLAVEAARDRKTIDWTGDVYKVIPVLEKYRPDLILLPMHTMPTGLLVVLGLDPTSTVLRDHYDEIHAAHVTADPQDVPDRILDRTDAWNAATLADSELWEWLRAARDAGMSREEGLPKLRTLVASLRTVHAADLSELPVERPRPRAWPPQPVVKKAAAKKAGAKKTAAKKAAAKKAAANKSARPSAQRSLGRRAMRAVKRLGR